MQVIGSRVRIQSVIGVVTNCSQVDSHSAIGVDRVLLEPVIGTARGIRSAGGWHVDANASIESDRIEADVILFRSINNQYAVGEITDL